MKFKKPENFKEWTLEETEAQIEVVKKDVITLCREINAIDGKIALLRNQKIAKQVRISHKNRYLNQLGVQREEKLNENEWNGIIGDGVR